MSQPKKGSAKPDDHRMKIVPVYFPDVVVEAIDILIERGVYPDRSSAIRSIVIQSLPDVFVKYGMLEDLTAGFNRAPAAPASTSPFSFKIPPAQAKALEEMASVLGVESHGFVVRMALDHFYKYHYLPFFKPLAESLKVRREGEKGRKDNSHQPQQP
jgi:hypothetical protein